MNDGIDARTAAREEALRVQLAGQRRLARPEDYVYDKAQSSFWDLLDGTLHGDEAVDASIPKEFWRVVVEEPPSPEPGSEPKRGRPAIRKERLVKPSVDIQRVENDQFVEGSTWWPGAEQLVKDWFISSDGFFKSPGRRIYNQYKPPPAPCGDAAKADPWLKHVKILWPDPAEHEYFFDYCAHMVQKPEEKCNAGIILSGAQRIGKDAALRPVKSAVGAWNTKGIEPDQLFIQYKPFLQTLMLVVDEARPSKDEFRATAMYNILKPLMAAPPDTLPLEDKYARLRYVINVMRLFITTNDYMAMYIPPGDGRYFIMHSHKIEHWYKSEGQPNYFVDLFGWMDAGGSDHVASWLAARDLSAFNPKGEVHKTAGWGAVAGTWEEPDDGIGFALDALKRPQVLFGAELVNQQFDNQEDVAGMLKSPRKIGHRMQREGYTLLPNPKGERWSFVGAPGSPPFRSRLAFVQRELAANQKDALAAMHLRGAEIAARRSSGGNRF